MAHGDFYDCQKYNWQLRESADNRVFIRYDSLPIDKDNKGRYNTSALVKVEANEYGQIRITTQSGSIYGFHASKCVHPMHLIALTMRFGVAF